MSKSYKNMSYTQLLTERERISQIVSETKSPYLKRDYSKYLKKIEERILKIKCKNK